VTKAIALAVSAGDRDHAPAVAGCEAILVNAVVPGRSFTRLLQFAVIALIPRMTLLVFELLDQAGHPARKLA
jgi:hypothetical protein